MQRFSFLRMMKKVNTLIVGLGLAGIAYAETLRKAGKQFHVIAEKQAGSSVIAAAVYNPTVLKRYTLGWKGLQFHQTALPFYQKLEKLLHTQLLFPYPIHKLFNKAGEHNLWSVAADSTVISNYLDPEIYQSNLTGVKSPFGYGKVLNCGRLDTSTLIHAYQTFLATDFEQTEFIYSQLDLSNDKVRYMDI